MNISESHHRFNSEEPDWGFKVFLNPKIFFAEEKGKRFVIDDTITLCVAIRVFNDPTGVLWHNFIKYDSKQETGRVGLRNQGATCYMNSLLQSLFYTSAFRKAVYQIPTDNEESLKSISLALQRVFYLLEHSNKPVDTTELTKSFGWDSRESFMQHDVQEFNRVLCDKLETKMKGTPAEGAINKLFEGKMKSYIKCINVDYESSREEAFYDIQLNVKGMKNLEESFRDYIQVETLEGDNKYFAEGHGLQEAKKGVTFLTLPPVLHLQLKRFEYDMTKDRMVKINDRYDFPDQIDLSKFLEKDAGEPQVYHLYGVLVHCGDVHGGHYCAFIKMPPNSEQKDEWLKFDDEIVCKALKSEAMEENYGFDPDKESPGPGSHATQTRSSKFSRKSTNAYMLVYVREKETDTVFPNISSEILSNNIHKQFESEIKEEEERKKLKEEQHLYITIKVATDQIFSDHHYNDLCNFEPSTLGVEPIILKMKKSSTFLEVKQAIEEKTGINVEKQRVWMMAKRTNKTVRPDEICALNDSDKLEKLKECNKQNPEVRFYVEESVDQNGKFVFLEYNSDSDFLIFLKSYNPETKVLQYEGKIVLKKNATGEDVVKTINQRINRSTESPLLIFEEVRLVIVEKIKLNEKLMNQEMGNGDIIIYQDFIEETKENEDKLAPSFFEYLVNRVSVVLRSYDSQKDEKKFVEIEISKKKSYLDLLKILSKKLGHDHDKIRLLDYSQYTDGPRVNAEVRSVDSTIESILQSNLSKNGQYVMFYELLDFTLKEMEAKKQLMFFWLSSKISENGPFKALVNKDDTTQQLAVAVQDRLKKEIADFDTKQALRLYEVYAHKIIKVLKPEDLIGHISIYSTVYVEYFPQDQSENQSVKLVQVVHFNKDQYGFHGIPFYFALNEGETLTNTLSRLQSKLEINDKEWSKYKFAIIGENKIKYLSIEENPMLYDYQFSSYEYLGIDHPEKKVISVSRDKAIVIRD